MAERPQAYHQTTLLGLFFIMCMGMSLLCVWGCHHVGRLVMQFKLHSKEMQNNTQVSREKIREKEAQKWPINLYKIGPNDGQNLAQTSSTLFI